MKTEKIVSELEYLFNNSLQNIKPVARNKTQAKDDMFHWNIVMASVGKIIHSLKSENSAAKYVKELEDELAGTIPPKHKRVKKYYAPADRMEFYCAETDQWFNEWGQELRDPEEYNVNTEGYTPFGDE